MQNVAAVLDGVGHYPWIETRTALQSRAFLDRSYVDVG